MNPQISERGSEAFNLCLISIGIEALCVFQAEEISVSNISWKNSYSSMFWDSRGVFFIGFLDKGNTMIGEYSILLNK